VEPDFQCFIKLARISPLVVEVRMRVFITGGTGLVGTRLVPRLLGRGDAVMILTRRPERARAIFGSSVQVVDGDPTQSGLWMDQVGQCDAVVNLAGEGVFNRRWNDTFKASICDSRVKSTRNVAEALARSGVGGDRPRVLVNASAIGYYGPHADEELDENSPPGSDFMAQVCVEWEKAAAPAGAAAVRCAFVRIGVVLDKEGGALAKLLTPFKLFAGGPVAGGRQWMSWIHHEDLISLLHLALDRQDFAGPLNATAPNPVTNREFGKALGKVLHRPSLMPTPGFMLRLGLGEVAEVVTKGQKVLPRRALVLGYTFEYPTVDVALAQILG
jgi:uncharacterized protein (TIGR01777 family)